MFTFVIFTWLCGVSLHSFQTIKIIRCTFLHYNAGCNVSWFTSVCFKKSIMSWEGHVKSGALSPEWSCPVLAWVWWFLPIFCGKVQLRSCRCSQNKYCMHIQNSLLQSEYHSAMPYLINKDWISLSNSFFFFVGLFSVILLFTVKIF